MRLEIRTSEAFMRRLDAFAKARGTNRSEALRQALLEASPAAPPSELPEPCDRDELLRLLTEAARGGSVTAIRVLLEGANRRGATAAPAKSMSMSVIDDLAARRKPA